MLNYWEQVLVASAIHQQNRYRHKDEMAFKAEVNSIYFIVVIFLDDFVLILVSVVFISDRLGGRRVMSSEGARREGGTVCPQQQL